MGSRLHVSAIVTPYWMAIAHWVHDWQHRAGVTEAPCMKERLRRLLRHELGKEGPDPKP